MLKSSYSSVYIILGDGTPIIRTGNYSYGPRFNHLLTDVTVKEKDGVVTVHGYKRKFEHHYEDSMCINSCLGINVEKDIDNYCIEESDWETVHPDPLKKLFGAKPKKRLKAQCYMHKLNKKEMVFVFHNGVVEEHYS